MNMKGIDELEKEDLIIDDFCFIQKETEKPETETEPEE